MHETLSWASCRSVRLVKQEEAAGPFLTQSLGLLKNTVIIYGHVSVQNIKSSKKESTLYGHIHLQR